MSNLYAEILDNLDKIPGSRKDVVRLLDKMDHDMRAAESEELADWVIKKVHEAILNGCTALMAAQGYRVKAGPWHHYVTVRFAQLALPEHRKLLDRAEMLRRRRHQVTYGTSYTVSEEETKGALELVRQLASILKEAAMNTLAQAESEQKEDREN